MFSKKNKQSKTLVIYNFYYIILTILNIVFNTQKEKYVHTRSIHQ